MRNEEDCILLYNVCFCNILNYNSKFHFNIFTVLISINSIHILFGCVWHLDTYNVKEVCNLVIICQSYPYSFQNVFIKNYIYFVLVL